MGLLRTIALKRGFASSKAIIVAYSPQHKPPTDYGMRPRDNCRRRTINAAVTVTYHIQTGTDKMDDISTIRL